jgi:GTP-binding protein
VCVTEDGSLIGGAVNRDDVVYDETAAEERHELPLVESGAGRPTRNQISHERDSCEQVEAFRFTIADDPGDIEDALDNVGLGHSFLRFMESSLALV